MNDPHCLTAGPMAEQLENAILENAQGPAKAAGDSGSMEQHKLPDQIAATAPHSGSSAPPASSTPVWSSLGPRLWAWVLSFLQWVLDTGCHTPTEPHAAVNIKAECGPFGVE